MPDSFASLVSSISSWAIPIIILVIVLVAAVRRVRVYEVFVSGAKEGFNVGVRIIPYLVAILVAIGMFRGSGAMDWVISALAPILSRIGVPAEALPMMVIMPLSGSGAQGVLADGLKTYGADSYLGNLLSVLNGSNETTFYIIAIYFGSVAIRNARHALAACLAGNIAGFAAAIAICSWVFG
jgi:spore maturation protein B